MKNHDDAISVPVPAGTPARTSSLDPQNSIRVAVALLFATLFTYFTSTVFHPFPTGVERLLFLAVGPLSALGTFSLGQALRHRCDGLVLRLGILMLVVSGVVMHLMAVVQETHFAFTRERLTGLAEGPERDAVVSVFHGVNTVHLGLDVGWDVWISFGTTLLALALLRFPLPRWFCGLGVVVSLTAITLNLVAFPHPPSDTGLPDFGPVMGLWYTVALLWILRRFRREASHAAS